MNTFHKLLSFQRDIFETNTSKGFWPEGRNKGEAVMLIITELSEAVESDRKKKRYDKEYNPVAHNQGDFFLGVFEKWCKDTVEDEMADTVIRLLDCAYGFAWELFEKNYDKESLQNFGHDVLRLNWYILLAFEEKTELHPGKDWGYALSAIVKFCEWYQIDIVQHVEWKLKYNKTRAYMHGGKSY